MNWTITHGFFLQMGGMVADNGQTCLTLNRDSFKEYVKKERISTTITAEEIKDKSKGDVLSKGLVVMQTSWFVIQCIARCINGLPLTELELVTLAFAALNCITYAFWWHKPLDIQRPIIVATTVRKPRLSSALHHASDWDSSDDEEDKIIGEEPLEADIGVYSLDHLEDVSGGIENATSISNSSPDTECNPAVVPYSTAEDLEGAPSQPVVHERDRCPSGDELSTPKNTWRIPRALCALLIGLSLRLNLRKLWRPYGRVEDGYSDWSPIIFIGGILIGFLFGGIHCIGWSFQFPSHADRMIWRVSSGIITGAPIIPLSGIILPTRSPYSSPWVRFGDLFFIDRNSWGPHLFYFLVYLYLGARIALFVIALKSIWNLPSDAAAFIDLEWSKFFPHL